MSTETDEPGNESDKPFSLISPTGMGGIIGGDGYSFQERYIVCKIPEWLNNESFRKLMNEGAGDVDVQYLAGDNFYYDHVQVKDHNIKPSEFTDVLKSFVKIDDGIGKVYQKYILVAPSLSPVVKSLAKAINRYRSAKEFYNGADRDLILKTTEDALSEKISSIGVSAHKQFIIDKLHFEVGVFDFNDNHVCKRQFVSALIEHTRYRDYFGHLIDPVYSKLVEEISAHRGRPLDHEKIHSLIESVLTAPTKQTQSTVIHVHNWTIEKYDPEASIIVDWSEHFVRHTRSVPDAEVWNTELIPQLYNIRQDIAKTSVSRDLVLRGKCALSTGFALGIVFPEVGNWNFEILQYPQTWRSDAVKIANYALKYETVDPVRYGIATDNQELAVIFNISGEAMDEVVSYLIENNISVKQLILIDPSNTPGNLSIKDDSEAVSLASASKDVIKSMMVQYKTKKTHLFYFGPLGLSILLGQKLTSVGQIQLYEFQDPGYKASCVMRT